MFLVSNAFQAGPLAASQPGLTIVDPLVASLLGITLFGEQLRFGPWHLAGEVVAVGILVASVVLLSRSPLIKDGQVDGAPPARSPPTHRARTIGRDRWLRTSHGPAATGSGGRTAREPVAPGRGPR